ncbi:MAG: Type 1 glutamine amidotransferase-like domain-containing protein [Fimbriimonas sp.]
MLFLYSDRCEPLDERLFSALPRKATVGYLPSSPDPARAWFRDREAHYARGGARLEFFGLETEFDPHRTDALFACDAIHLTGGNTFQFLYWLRRRGWLPRLQRYVAEGGVLVGVSAGAILMTPDIRTSALCGDEPYPGLDDFSGLGLVDFAIYPHYDGSPDATQALRNYASTYDGTVYGIPDGSGIVMDSPHMELMGPIFEVNRRGVGRIETWSR